MRLERIPNHALALAIIASAAFAPWGCGGDGVTNAPFADAAPAVAVVAPDDEAGPTLDAASSDDGMLGASPTSRKSPMPRTRRAP